MVSNKFLIKYEQNTQIDLEKYKQYEQAELIIPNDEINQIISKMFFNNEIYCLREWIECSAKTPPMFIAQTTSDFYNINENNMSNYAKMIRKAEKI